MVAQLRQALMRHPPFAQMESTHVDGFIAASQLAYYAPGEVVLQPEDGPVDQLLCIRDGSVAGRHGPTDSVRHEAGALFPIGALMGQRPVSATYVAMEDTFCLLTPAPNVQALAARSAPLADFLNRRMTGLLALSQQALQASRAAQALAEFSLQARLATLPARTPLFCRPEASLGSALQQMQDARVGSIVVVDLAGVPQGILTRHDILARVALVQCPLQTAMSQVMSQPVHSLDTQHSLQDAALLMSSQGIRHVVVTDAGRLVNVVSERDLFALQRLSLRQVGQQIRSAADLGALQLQAANIRQLAGQLARQGVQARQLTELISQLNDLLTARLVQQVAAARRLDLAQACWLAFGSEGRGEQTVATDQDNGLVLDLGVADGPAGRAAWLALAREVNDGLDACGYPLCKGGVMASNPDLCLSVPQWLQRFEHWLGQGSPQDLLNASIQFDLRPVAGQLTLAQPLRELITQRAQQLPRFIKLLADNACQRQAPLNWLGGIQTQLVEGRPMLDLKLQGTALFVDAARLYALALGIGEVGTAARLEAVGAKLGVAAAESQGWVAAFEYLQMLRLRVQSHSDAMVRDHPNLIDVRTLNDIDRSVLKETLRTARRLRQRIALDYGR